MKFRWPFSREIKPVLIDDVPAAELLSKELDEQAGETGMKLLASVAHSYVLAGQIRERLADGVVLELRGR